jgi:hypothetical protein
MRLRAHDYSTSSLSTLVGGKGGIGPSSLHTTLEGPTGICECKMDVKSLHKFLHGIEWIMFHGHVDYFQKPSFGGRPDTKLGDHGTPNAHNCWFIIIYHVWGPVWIEIRWNSIWLRAWLHMMTSHYTWRSVTTLYDFGGVLGRPVWTLSFGLSQCHGHGSTLSFGLSQCHGHGSWLLCEVAHNKPRVFHFTIPMVQQWRR